MFSIIEIDNNVLKKCMDFNIWVVSNLVSYLKADSEFRIDEGVADVVAISHHDNFDMDDVKTVLGVESVVTKYYMDHIDDLTNNYKLLHDLEVHLYSIFEVEEYKYYILGLLFYRYLSEYLENHLNHELINDNITFKQAWTLDDKDLKEAIITESLDFCGFFIKPEYLFSSIVEKLPDENLANNLSEALDYIVNSTEGQQSEDNFKNIFSNINMENIPYDEENTNSILSDIIDTIAHLTFNNNELMGDLFNFLANKFQSQNEAIIPDELRKLILNIITCENTKIKTIYDPTCNIASNLVEISKHAKIGKIYAQERSVDNYNIARMNLIINQISYDEFKIQQVNTLAFPQDKKYDVVVSQIPFWSQWNRSPHNPDDPRFKDYSTLAPKTRAYYAHLQNMIHATCDDGICVAVMTSEILLNKTPAEEILIREFIEKYNYIDTIIQLPEYLIDEIKQKLVIVIMKKNRKKSDKIQFINAEENYEKIHHFYNKLRIEDIQKIINTYKNKCEIEEYSHLTSIDEIASNDYDMRISLYTDPYTIYMDISHEAGKVFKTQHELYLEDLTKRTPIEIEVFHGAEEVYYDITPGAINTWIGYTSTSPFKEVAEDFAGDMQGSVIYKIIIPEYTPLIPVPEILSETPPDNEFKLKINQKFKVIESKQENGRNYVTVELINKPKTLTEDEKLLELTHMKNKMLLKEYEDFQEKLSQNNLLPSEKRKQKYIQIQIQKILKELKKIDEQLTEIKEKQELFTKDHLILQAPLDHYNIELNYYKNLYKR